MRGPGGQPLPPPTTKPHGEAVAGCDDPQHPISAAPPTLGPRAATFWAKVQADFELSDVEHELLVEACRLLDECERLNDALTEGGLVVAGSTGQPRVHPALTELRQHRLALGRLMAQLDLPDEDTAAGARTTPVEIPAPTSLPTPRQAASRKANRARWAGLDTEARRARGTA